MDIMHTVNIILEKKNVGRNLLYIETYFGRNFSFFSHLYGTETERIREFSLNESVMEWKFDGLFGRVSVGLKIIITYDPEFFPLYNIM